MTFKSKGDDFIAVEKIEQYGDTLKVILKPTKHFPVGYFYCDSEDIDIIQGHTWLLSQQSRNIYVVAHGYRRNNYYLHRELAFKYLGYYPDYIDHCNLCEIDNVDSNLNEVSNQQNMHNKATKNYLFDVRRNNFQTRIKYNQDSLYPYGVVKTELEACIQQRELETVYLKDLMQDDYYMYDFLKDRRNDLDILDLERTKQISEEEAIYRHVLRYADNAWFYHRYNLEQYFKDNHIPVPDFDIDEQGFMIDKVTRKRLCPF